MAALTLGSVLFRDFEIPSKLSGAIGGKQSLGKHKLLGGARVTQAMGTDPEDPAWEGRFRGPNAVSRAELLDAIKDAGQEVLLTCGSIQYTVVIEEFVADYMQAYEIPYRIRCYITQVNTQSVAPSLDDAVTSDNSALTGQAAQFNSNAQDLADGIAAL